MSNLRNLINTLCLDLISDKINVRNKAAEQLEKYLSSSKIELLAVLRKGDDDDDASWSNIFTASIHAIIKHSIKLQESEGNKTFQTIRNKCGLYHSIINKLINYNLEDSDHLISKKILFQSFAEGYKTPATILYFGDLFVNILTNGIYKSAKYVRELKYDEFSIILRNLLEVNYNDDNLLLFASLKASVRTLELAYKHIAFDENVMHYLPLIVSYAANARDNSKKTDVINFYNIILEQYFVESNYYIASELQAVLPEIIAFYEFSLKVETKELLFKAILTSLHIVYPYIHLGKFTSFNVPINDTWIQTIKKIKAIVDIEINGRIGFYNESHYYRNECGVWCFSKMAALVTYLYYWHTENNCGDADDCSLAKIPKTADKLEKILNCIQLSKESLLNGNIWLMILTELITGFVNVINVNNFQQILTKILEVLQNYNTAVVLKNVRLCLKALLSSNKLLIDTTSVGKDFCHLEWQQVGKFLLSDTNTNAEILLEKQLIIQELIAHQQFSADNCIALMQMFMSNSIYRRNECIETVQVILQYADQIEFDKMSEIIKSFLQWMFDDKYKNDFRNILLHIEPIKADLIANTCAIAVINFLNKESCESPKQSSSVHCQNLIFIEYKYNNKFICLERHGYEKKLQMKHNSCQRSSKKQKICLFQSNYEYLMAIMNFETSAEISNQHLLNNLTELLKMTSLMKNLLQYEVFDESNYTICPLIKRIGFLLCHLELQFKNDELKPFEYATVIEILKLLEQILNTFIADAIFLEYFGKQSVKGLLYFVDNILKYTASEQETATIEIGDLKQMFNYSYRILAILCACTSHSIEAFECIASHNICFKNHTHTIIDLIRIFCQQKTATVKIACWFVGKLKSIFKCYYSDVDLMESILSIMPQICVYVQHNEDNLDDMLLALSSLLKISYRKSYPIKLIVKIIDAIARIAYNCNEIYLQENFKNICISVVKFLSFNSIYVQFSTINTITAIMDLNLQKNTNNLNEYYQFCNEIYKAIDWKHLQSQHVLDKTQDELQNIIALNIQLCISLIAFSCFHREIAYQELTYACVCFQQNEGNFREFKQIAKYYKTNLTLLTKPYLNNAIHHWIGKSYPILKFPFFLSYESKHEFVSNNIGDIVTCLLLYNKRQQLETISSYGNLEQLLEIAGPQLLAFILCEQSKANENVDFKKNVKNILKINPNIINVLANNSMSWQTIYYLLCLLRDDEFAQNALDIAVHHHGQQWYHINYATLIEAILLYLNIANDNKVNMGMQALVARNPLNLVKVYSMVKKVCSESLFYIDSRKEFFKFFILSDIVFDTLQQSTVSENCAKYFTSDIIFFNIHVLRQDVLRYIDDLNIKCLEIFLNKISKFKDAHRILENSINYLTRSLLTKIENGATNKTYERILNIFENLIKNNLIPIAVKESIIYMFLDNEHFSGLRELLNAASPSNLEQNTNWKHLINEIIDNNLCGVDALKLLENFILNNRECLHMEEHLLYKLIRFLLTSVRNSQNSQAVSLAAVECLGQLGPMRLSKDSFYFELNTTLSTEYVQEHPVVVFHRSLYKSLEQLMQTFKASTDATTIEVAQYVVNSQFGCKLLEDFPCFVLFKADVTNNYLNDCYRNFDINWLDILKGVDESSQYNLWLCQLASKLFAHCEWIHLSKLSMDSFAFSEAIFIPFIQMLIRCQPKQIKGMTAMLNFVFETFTQQQQESSQNNSINDPASKLLYKDKRVIRTFLRICECIRVNNKWLLPLNLLDVVRASNYCRAYFLSIIYLELWAQDQLEILSDKQNNNFLIMSDKEFQKLSKQAYESIGYMDAVSGFINPLSSRFDYLKLTSNWSDILVECTNLSSSDNSEFFSSVLRQYGLYNLANMNPTNSTTIDYETCWRLCNWDQFVEGHSIINTDNSKEYEFQKHHFNALKCLHSREEANSLAAIDRARFCVFSILQEISVECLQNVYKYLTWLQMLQHAEDFTKVQFLKIQSADKIFENWQLQSDVVEYGNFNCKEQILSHQISLFNLAGIRALRKIEHYYKVDPIQNHLLKCINLCKNAGKTILTKRYIARLRDVTNNKQSMQMKAIVLLEDADICMKTGKMEIARSIIHELLTNKDYTYYMERVRATQMKGVYLMETKNEAFEVVLGKYFKGAVDLLQKYIDSKDVILKKNPDFFILSSSEDFSLRSKTSAYETIGHYAHTEYTQLHTYSNSYQFNMKREIMEHNRKAADNIKLQNTDRDKRTGAALMKRYSNLDEQEIKMVEDKITWNLCVAVEHYLKLCTFDTNQSTSPIIYRIIALWFANKQNKQLNHKISEHIDLVPSYKFICALQQIIAHLHTDHEEFLTLIKSIMIRCLRDHPYQTFYHLLPLMYEPTSDASMDQMKQLRVKNAQDIINSVQNNTNTNILKQLQIIIPALIELANLEVNKSDNKLNTITLSNKLNILKHMNHIHCLTVDLPVRIDLKYDIISIVKWEKHVSLVGGINAPKKLLCLCSDGVVRPQLLKGRDDLRQDAVMQQAFGMINTLLQQEFEATEQKLSLRTYKVLPLSMRTGILEWCENTIPIGTYLTESHVRFRPNDYTVKKCRQLAMQVAKSEPEVRLKMYMQICKNIKPIFHYFFFEKFHIPGIWFERRLAYINSVATTSIVGFILGLGDRHAHNILIDELTAEVVHIDFGIAFEQGKIMPTPETVPFRLTRDVVAPMGISGPNGVFKKSCEATINVLRRHQVVITTILEVLLYDPLYMWNIVPQICKTEIDAEKNFMAQRALLVVQNKLEGKQEGIIGTIAASVQIERLINEAISPRNLCMLFPGWDPYL